VKNKKNNLLIEEIQKIIEEEPYQTDSIKKKIALIKKKFGIQTAFNLINQIETKLKIKKPSLAIYDHAFHFIGGAQKYGLTLINALENLFEITIISNRSVSHKELFNWYGLDFHFCKIKIIPLEYFDKNNSHIEPALVKSEETNPFMKISIESGNYDFFINNSMNEMIYPLANVSIMICHFPERRPRIYFYSDYYDYIVYNSEYTAGWIKKRWNIKPHKHIYPPVDMEQTVSVEEKENIILSVARFEIEGTKKQRKMVETFIKLNDFYPDLFANWKLILVGGSGFKNHYLEDLKKLIEDSGLKNIIIKTNINSDDLRQTYTKAKIFWHLCGLNQTEPEKIEHFGMTIVEAMQNNIVPIVFDGGGQKEIVVHNVSGFRVKSTAQLISYTLEVIRSNNILNRMGLEAYKRSKLFNRDKFETKVLAFFKNLLKSYISFD